ncbi:MAG: hypothetical protein IH988_06800 [Planctomycetes bacterium]|nr:hypothetical protein [Planctomycetota bacterium]
MLQIHTDSSELARAYQTLGTDARCGNNRVEVNSNRIAGTIFFCASATPAPAAQINSGSRSNQRAEINGPACTPRLVASFATPI